MLQPPRPKRMAGMTIIRLMVMLGIIGIVATVVVDLVIDKRCKEEPSAMLCKDRSVPKGR